MPNHDNHTQWQQSQQSRPLRSRVAARWAHRCGQALRRVRSGAGLLAAGLLLSTATAQAGTLGSPTLSPTSINAGSATLVTVTIPITDPKYLAGSANLQRLRPDGSVLAVVATLHDDGQDGDAVAGDQTYSARISLQEAAAGSVRLQVSAAFRGELKRTSSSVMTVTVNASTAAPVIDAATIGPASTPAGVALLSTVTATLTSTTLVPTSVVLQKLAANGSVAATVGTLHDDGLNGDTTAADKTYSLRTTVLENASGQVNYRVAASFDGLATVYSAPLSVAITGTATGITIATPANAAYLNTPVVTVSGQVGDASAQVSINGISTPVSNQSFNASVPLNEGPNVVTAVATNSNGTTSTNSILVTLDTTAPHVQIYAPAAGGSTTAAAVTVTGMVNDIVVGTVNPQQATVTVNGVAATVANRSFQALNVPLALGSNTVQAVATDRAGNRATTSISVVRAAATSQTNLSVVSGNNQSGPVGGSLAAPLVTRLVNAQGVPQANKPVVFRIVSQDGTVSPTGAAGSGLSAVAINTDAQGLARAFLKLGSRAGSGNNLVEASATGVATTADFSASGTPGTPTLVVVDSGNNQNGVVGQPLPLPFIAIVTDGNNNRLANVPVSFEVRQGNGSLSSSNGTVNSTAGTLGNATGGATSNPALTTTLQTTSDSDGRIAVTLTLGPDQGVNNNIVEALLPGSSSFPAAFAATGMVPGPADQTRISGVVLDNSNNPLPGVTMRLLNINQGNFSNIPQTVAPAVRTDAQGQFVMTGVPVGVFKLMADGGTTTRSGLWPTLDFDMITVPGQNNTLGMPVFLPELNPNNRLCVNDTSGGTLTVAEAPGFALTIAPGSATFPGGSKTGCVSATPVNMDKVPMSPGFGQQPRFVVTIQPVGTHFNPPARMSMPNVDGLAPRAVTEMYSYDHDLASFVAIGSATVSEDGSTITSDAGSGVIKAGWHCGGNPNSTGSAGTCPECQKCQGTNCVADASRDGQACTVAANAPGACKNGNCIPLAVKLMVNGTDATDDDLTALNGAQTLPITVQLTDGPTTPTAISLELSPNNRGTLSPSSVSLAKGQSSSVTFTPTAVSAAANDVTVTAKYGGKSLTTAQLTVVNIAFPAIKAAGTPAGMPDRIPPRIDTAVTVTIVPDLSSTSQRVELATKETNAQNGDFTIGGAATASVSKTGDVQLKGVTQTAATGGSGGGNASKLKVAAKVRGAEVSSSAGFSVAAIPSNLNEAYIGNIVTAGGIGIRVSVAVKSDSGNDADLDECEFSEQIEVKAEAGGLVGLGGGLNSAYLACVPSSGSYSDSHGTPTSVLNAVGTQNIDQTHTLKDRRLGITDIAIPKSGYKIDRDVFKDPPASTNYRLKTSKYGGASTANGYSASAGIASPAVMTGTQP